jgi:hypothetical protein
MNNNISDDWKNSVRSINGIVVSELFSKSVTHLVLKYPHSKCTNKLLCALASGIWYGERTKYRRERGGDRK